MLCRSVQCCARVPYLGGGEPCEGKLAAFRYVVLEVWCAHPAHRRHTQTSALVGFIGAA